MVRQFTFQETLERINKEKEIMASPRLRKLNKLLRRRRKAAEETVPEEVVVEKVVEKAVDTEVKTKKSTPKKKKPLWSKKTAE